MGPAKAFLFVGLALWAYGQAAGSQATAPSTRKATQGVVRDIAITRRADGVEIKILTDVTVVPEIRTLTGPDRLIIDLPECEFRGPKQRLSVNSGPVISVRASTFKREPLTARVVVDLTSAVDHRVDTSGNGLLVKIDFPNVARAAPAAKAPATKVAGTNKTVAGVADFSSPSASKEREEPKTGKFPKITSTPVGPSPNAGSEDADVLMKRARDLSLPDLQQLQSAADAGDPESETMLALAYHTGTLLNVNDGEALRLLQKASNGGYVPAEEALAMFYQAGIGVQQNPGEAVAWYTRAAQHGSINAASNLGTLYAMGTGVPKDLATARTWFQKAAEAGDATAQYNLASMYRRGEGAPRDEKEYLRWITAAAEQNHLPAMLQLARYYLRVTPSSASDSRAGIGWLEKAANLGDSLAQAMLGAIYSNGLYRPPDYPKAVEWLRKAAEQGQREAEFGLGARYLAGQGVPSDATEARRWFTAAARQGQPDAQYDLGLMYELGRGGQPDKAAAAQYYEMAADNGIADAQYRLGLLLAKGEEVPRDEVSAYKWLFLSKEKVQESARALSEVAKTMSPEQLQEAERKINRWREAHKQQTAPDASLASPGSQAQQ
jgi:TPR repeat protein